MFNLPKKAHTSTLRKRILIPGISLTVVPMLLVLFVIWIANSQANAISLGGYSKLANQQLDSVVLSLLSACELYDGYLTGAVNGARTLLHRTGEVHFDASDSISWNAKNQFTNQVSTIRLPLMRVGEIAVRPVSNFSVEAPIVDEVQTLYDLSATIFQRMNDQGDMLRVATNVKKSDGTRAIGTYIPAFGANGAPNPVVSRVLRGEPYLGRAFVVNSWYIAAYQPLKDAKGNVIGMIYTGAQEAPVRDKILAFKNLSDREGHSEVFIVHAQGKEKGLFVLSSDPSLQDHNGWAKKDSHGNSYVQEICSSALAHGANISDASFWAEPKAGGAPEKMLVRFIYFPSWDWVIGVQQPESDFLAVPSRIKSVFRVTNYVPLILVLLSSAIALLIWDRLTRQIAGQITTVMTNLEQSSALVTAGLQAIGGAANSVGESADDLSRSTQDQAAAAEQTSAATSLIAQTARKNSQSAEQMLLLTTSAEGIVVQAKKTMQDVNLAMATILDANDEALTIIDTINEISFATNIVALNASVEAARAGDAGRTFVFIAEEVRDLAAKVGAAVQETRRVIASSRQQINRGTSLVEKLSSAFDPMNENADQLRRLAEDLTATSVSQSQGMEHVLYAIEDMQRTTESTAQSALQSTRDAGELRSQVAHLSGAISSVDQAVEKLNRGFLTGDQADLPPAGVNGK